MQNNAVHQQLQTSRSHILALTETQIKPTSHTIHLLRPGYELQTNFLFKNGLGVYKRNDKKELRNRRWSRYIVS